MKNHTCLFSLQIFFLEKLRFVKSFFRNEFYLFLVSLYPSLSFKGYVPGRAVIPTTSVDQEFDVF